MFDKILEKYNLKYDDLTSDERETLNNWITSLQQGALTIEKIKEYIHAMRDAVEAEITKVENNTKQDTLLKARLRNYLLFEGFLSTPEKAQRALDQALSGIKK